MEMNAYAGLSIILFWLFLFVWVGFACKNINPLNEIKAFLKKQSTSGRIVFLLFFLAMTIYGGTKPTDGSSTNDVNNVSGSTNMSADASLGQLHTGQIDSSSNSLLSDNVANSSEQLDIPSSFTNEDFERGFVLTRVATDEVFDFSAPANAVVCEDWRAFGAATDWMYIAMTNWAFNVGTNYIDSLRVFSFGKVEPYVFEEEAGAATNYWFAPFVAKLGIVPEANEELLLESSKPSQVWYQITPQDSLIITWQNALLDRDVNKPVSFQVEFNPDGLFTYRYDFSRLDTSSITNIIAGASFAGNTWATNTLSSSVTSMTFYQLTEDDFVYHDPDGDGIVTIVELFLYGTNPQRADSDYDGISDYKEIYVYETNPNNAHSLSEEYYDGIAVALGNLNPHSYQGGSTNTVLQHIFYSGSANGHITLPTSNEEFGVLKITVSGEGTGKLVVDNDVVPLIGSPRTRSGNSSNTLLLKVGKGKRKSLWFEKPEGLEVALDSDDFFIGDLPTWYYPHGWIAFPHTEATHPCIHEIADKNITVSLVHGEEFDDLTATWEGGQVVTVTNVPPVSAELYAGFSRDQTGYVSYVVNHPKQLNKTIPTFEQEFRYCPPLDVYDDDDEDKDKSSLDYELDKLYPYEEDYECYCEYSNHCVCTDEVCVCPSFWCHCNLSRYPDVDGDESEDSVTNLLTNVTPLSNVLYLHRDNIDTIDLDVPGGTPKKCCPCEEHWASNYVAKVSHQSRISVTDANGENFKISYEPCSVNVSGVGPSRDFNDTSLLFVTNGIPYKQIDYTILGLTFKGDILSAPISKYETLNSYFGYPATMTTNLDLATAVYISTDILLTNGTMKVSIENATGDFSLWLPGWEDNEGNYYPPEMFLQNGVINERYYSIKKWRQLCNKFGNSRELRLKILSTEVVNVDLKIEFISSNGTNYVRDFDTLRVTTVLPPLRFDITRDGSIDNNDLNAMNEGRKFNYWLNDDGVDNFTTYYKNIDDTIINNIDDLINFFPVAIDFNAFRRFWGNRVTYQITSDTWGGEKAANYCFANVPWSIAGDIQTKLATTITLNDENITYNSTFASELKPLIGWSSISLPNALFELFSSNSGIMLCEAASTRLQFGVLIKLDGEILYSYDVPMKIHRVKDMYSWLNYRSVSDDNSGRLSVIKKIEGEEYDKNLLFFHGANIDNEAAENWGDTIFKRFWVAGIKANFYNIDWRSDIGTPANYHQNVSNSFVVAQRIAPSIKAIAEEKDTVVMAHSLGNMVVSSMIQDYNLQVSKYMMVNSAVPVEAYDSSLSLRTPSLVHSDWVDYPTNSWASSWHTLFKDFENDDRKYLGWPNRFSNVASVAVNFYSSGDEVLELATTNNISALTGIESFGTLSRFCWHKQELFKGRGYFFTHGFGFSNWAGWDIRQNQLTVNEISPEEAWTMTDADFRTNTVFNCYPESMNTNVIDRATRGAHLAYGIPALTPATGASTFGGDNVLSENMIDLNDDSFKLNGWFRRDDYNLRWLHSDFKDVPYFLTFKFYEKVLEKGNLK